MQYVSKCGLYVLVNVDVTRCGMPHIEYVWYKVWKILLEALCIIYLLPMCGFSTHCNTFANKVWPHLLPYSAFYLYGLMHYSGLGWKRFHQLKMKVLNHDPWLYNPYNIYWWFQSQPIDNSTSPVHGISDIRSSSGI